MYFVLGISDRAKPFLARELVINFLTNVIEGFKAPTSYQGPAKSLWYTVNISGTHYNSGHLTSLPAIVLSQFCF